MGPSQKRIQKEEKNQQENLILDSNAVFAEKSIQLERALELKNLN